MSKAYIEDFNIIKFITKNIEINSITLCDNEYRDIEDIIIPPFYNDEYGKNYFLHCQSDLKVYLDYYLKINNNEFVHLHIGKITRSSKFDEIYSCDLPLGAIYQPDKTIFRLWSPVSKTVYVILDKTNKYQLNYLENGVYEISLDGDFEGIEYYFELRINESWYKVCDPYAYSSSINYQSSIVTNLDKIKTNKHHTNNEQLFIEEISIRDITSFNMGGTFIDLVNQKEKIEYLKSLGINTIQIMPVFGFGGVDETKDFDYNWGYNPIQYFSFSRYLTSNKKEYFGPIEEFSKLVNLLHEYDFNVVLDVVFNHVYDEKTNPISKTIPGYAYHYKNDGYLTNDSGCGNDLNTNKLMVRKLIIDCLKYYVKYFNIDGFRFDLMGLMDLDTMNLIKEELEKLNPNIILYGEGWDMSSSIEYHKKSIISNQLSLTKIGFFNDVFRDTIKKHFLNCENIKQEDLLNVLNSTTNYGYFQYNNQSINYIECHDDSTVYDYLKQNHPEYNINKIDEFISLGLCLVTLSNGISFYHLGQEFGRSKKGINNSYQSGDFINRVDFDQITNFKSVKTLKEIIKFKKDYIGKESYHYEMFSNNSNDELPTEYYFKLSQKGLDKFIVVIKNNYLKSKLFNINKNMLFNKNIITEEFITNIYFNEPGVWIFRI